VSQKSHNYKTANDFLLDFLFLLLDLNQIIYSINPGLNV